MQARSFRFSRLAILALALSLPILPAALHAEEADDALRPLIVRPTETGATTYSQQAATAVAPSVNVDAPIPLTPPSVDASSAGGQLRLPPPPAPSQIDLSTTTKSLTPSSQRKPVLAPSGGDLFANFGPPSGSSVSDRVFQLRDEAINLRQSVDNSLDEFTQLRNRGAAGAIQFHSTVAAITARLESGTTRGNPILLRQWSEAEQSLSEVHYSISKLNMLQTALSGNASNAAYLLQAVKAAFELSGALDEDHDQLAMVRDEVSKTIVGIDHTRNEINDDIRRQNTYLATERNNLQALSLSINRGELIRNSLAGQTVIVGNEPLLGSLPNTALDVSGFPSIDSMPAGDLYAPPPAPAPVAPVRSSSLSKSSLPTRSKGARPISSGEQGSLGQLLVLVRFNEPQVQYEDQLYQAVSNALDRKPDANFTVVAVRPKSNDPMAVGSDTESADRNAENVKSSLIQLGLQPSRISMSNTSSEVAQSPEVHLYIR